MSSIDVTVRGAGVMGLCAAFVLAERGARVRVVDPGGVGAGASGGVVGALAPHAPDAWDESKMFQLEALLLAPAFWARVERLGGPTGFARTGRIMRAGPRDEARAEAARLRWPGHAWTVVPPAPFGAWAPSDPVAHDTLTARVGPRRALAALARALEALGGEVVREAPVEGTLVTATGAAAPGMAAVKGQAALLALDARAPVVQLPGLYVVPHDDGTVAVGSTSEEAWDDAGPDARLDALVLRARAAVPALADAPVVERWAGLRPKAPGGRPVWGPDPDIPGAFRANGGYKIGFALAPLIAERLAGMI